MRLLALLLLLSARAQADAASLLTGCYDCFNFVAPTISGAESITSLQVGLIVEDSYYGGFRGYTSSNSWARLSNDKVMRTITSTGSVTSDISRFWLIRLCEEIGMVLPFGVVVIDSDTACSVN